MKSFLKLIAIFTILVSLQSCIVSEKSLYSADYVIVNGKKIYNEEEAIDITKEAFQLFASNVTKTINQAEPIKNLSINF